MLLCDNSNYFFISTVMRKRRNKMKKFIVMLLSAILCFGLAACGGGSDGGNADKPDTSTEAYSVQLTSGNYTAGIDIPIGVYNVTAVSGSGNVSSSNMYEGGINSAMGAEDVDDPYDMYEQTFSNLDMAKDVVLSVSGGVTIELTSDAAQTKNLTKRTPEGSECTLSNGNYTSGTHFDPGVYDITIVSGNGNVSSSNMYEGGINAIMGTDNSFGIYDKEYKNVELPEGETLTLKDVEVKLTPSK